MRLKLGGQLDYEVVQLILFPGYRVTEHQSLNAITLYRLFRYDLFPANSSYSLHRIGLILDGQLDHEMVQGLLFQGYSTPSFDRVITIFFKTF